MSEWNDFVGQAQMNVAGVQHQAAQAALAREQQLSVELVRPSYLYRPRLSIDGNQWCALYGANLQDGVAGFGDSPAQAYAAFDKVWTQPLPSAKP